MKKRWISAALILAMCVTCIILALAQEDEEVSIHDYLNGINEESRNAETDTGEGEGEASAAVDPTKPNFELDGSIVVTMSFTGDVTVGGNTQSNNKSIFERELEKQKGDINFPFRNVKDIFAVDDLTVVNFEGTLTTAGKNPDKLNNDYLFRAPPEYVSMLTYGGVDAVALENNHVLDMGESGLAETKETLLTQGIPYASEDEPAIVYARGIKIGLLAYQTFSGRHEALIGKVPGDIAALRNEGCQIVIVNYHWGAELDYAPNDNQVKLGRATIDGGADLVIGHHSHRINPIELYNGKYICYSLGNFSFAGNSKPEDMSTYIFQVKMRVKEGEVTNDGFIIIPCRISSRTDYNDFAPTPYTKDQNIQSLLSVLKKNGEKLSYAVEVYPLAW